MNNKYNNQTVLKFISPAKDWNEALPVGNGRLGGMVFSEPDAELIQLNEDSIWSGSFRKRENVKSFDNLEKIRSLIREGKVTEAENLCTDAFYATNEQQRHYMPMGDLHIWQQSGENKENYERSLDLSTALAVTEWTADGVNYRRTVFTSYPDNVMVIFFDADKPGKISFTAVIDGRDDYYDENRAYDDSTLLFTVSDCIPYATAIHITAEGGKAYMDANRLKAENADSAMLILACETAYRTGDYLKKAIGTAKTAARKTYEELLTRHKNDYSALYDRCGISVEDEADVPVYTNERLEAVRNGGTDNALAAMYFNFSRYLMISGSRPDSLPLNLQGIWNKDMWPAWGCKYTININTEMNYWGAEIQNLSECHTPLFDHIERMRENGRITAREMYHCGGTVCHHNTDIWGDTAPQDKWMPATLWPMGLAWLSTHIWEHYLFTGDRNFLADKYDTLREVTEFFVDYLTENENGELVTNPSVSPENTYITKTGEKGSLCEGPTMDSSILRQLFTAVADAADILETDSEYAEKMREMASRLPKLKTGKYGQIMEWAEDYDEVEPGHRHISQLYSLYPDCAISPDTDEKLAAAARATIERRLANGGGHTGWSRAWLINMWARLRDGEMVGKNVKLLLSNSTSNSLLDMHPPFQIDGNFGAGAGLAESIIQSTNGVIRLLPALIPSWKNGKAKGLRARGGYTVSFEWTDGRIVCAEVTADHDSVCRISGKFAADGCDISYADGITEITMKKGQRAVLKAI